MWYYQPIAEFCVYALGFLAVYVVPSVIAHHRDARHATLISALNVLLGWTILGWAAAFLWACLSQPNPGPSASEEAPALPAR